MKAKIMLALVGLTAISNIAADDSTYVVRGLEQPAEIIVDQWGVPHIFTSTHYDAFFVQGFNAARDRLWQIDVWRRRGLGLLSEVLGEAYIEQDRATRLFLYRGDMYREWLAYGSDAKRIAQAFTAGINAWIDLLEQHPELLPPEFTLLDYAPARWSAEDVVRIRGHGLWGNVEREVKRARIACAADLDTAAYWWQLEPQWKTAIPDGLDPCSVPEAVLNTYMLAKAPVVFTATAPPTHESDGASEDASEGSNNWVVAPARTATGRPILADDPHRGHAVPSLRYITHLVAPGLNVIGAGEPALPGISIGHNDRIAFGLTIFPIDQEDLYVYRKVAGKYRYGAGLQAFETLVENVPVRNQPAARVELKFSRHGPVVYENGTHAFALRTAWLEPGMAPYFGSVEYMRAGNWREFSSALNRWGAPAENQVYADVDGNIGYKPAGLFPRRSGWDGLLPVPGDGRYEWQGFHDMDVLPSEFNPARGFSGTANSMNLPRDYPIKQYPMSLEWSPAWRYDRLWRVLQAQPAHALQDSHNLQRDYRSPMALEAIKHIPPSITGPAAEMLRGWDGLMTADSAAAALFAVWFYRHLNPALARVLLPDNPELMDSLGTLGVMRLMAEPRSAGVIAASLDAAWAESADLLGDDPAQWQWGGLHEIRFVHPLLQLAGDDLAQQMKLPPWPRGGSGYTTNNAWFDPKDFLVRAGASYRQVIDVGNWDASTMTNAPGQSGDPRSPFYGNLLEDWARDGAFPLLYSREKILQHQAFTISLNPGPE